MTGVYDRSRPSVVEHIKEALGSVRPGEFMSVVRIAQYTSAQFPEGEPRPSPGAISALLFNKSEDWLAAHGIQAVERDKSPSGTRGARRLPDAQSSSTIATFSDPQ